MSKYINAHKGTSQKAMRIRWNEKNNLRLERMQEKKLRKGKQHGRSEKADPHNQAN